MGSEVSETTFERAPPVCRVLLAFTVFSFGFGQVDAGPGDHLALFIDDDRSAATGAKINP